MSPQRRPGGALRRAAGRMVPPARRDWIDAVWAESPDVPAGWRRLTWCAGGVRLMAREVLMRRATGTAILFALAAASAALAAWPGQPAYLAASYHRAVVIVMIVVLAGLPLLARRLLGPAGRSRTARALRVCTYVAVLGLIPADSIIAGFRDVPPHAGLGLRVYMLIDLEHRAHPLGGIAFAVIVTLCVTAILWLTSQRAQVAPGTLAVGAGAGAVFGAAVYAMAPLGLSKAATNPWLPGSDVDLLVLLAWVLVPVAPLAAGFLAQRRYSASGSPATPKRLPLRASSWPPVLSPAWSARCSSPLSVLARSR